MGKSKTSAPAAASQNAESNEQVAKSPAVTAPAQPEAAKADVPPSVLPSKVPEEAAKVAAEVTTVIAAQDAMPLTAPEETKEALVVSAPAEELTSRSPVEAPEVSLESSEVVPQDASEQQNQATPLLDRPLMASAQTTDEQVSRISAAVARAKSLLDDMRAKVGEYDDKYKASETASSYLGAPIRKAQAAFDQLASTAVMLKDKTVEVPTKALDNSLSVANGALANITDVANKYDEKLKFTSTLRMAVSVPHEKCKAALAEVSRLSSLASATASAQMQSINQGIRNRATSLANSSAGLVFTVAAALNGRLAIEDKALTVGSAVAGRAQKLDDRFSVKENLISLATKGLGRAQGLDSKVTGGKIAPVVLSAYETGFSAAVSGLSFVQNGYEDAKEQRNAKTESSQ